MLLRYFVPFPLIALLLMNACVMGQGLFWAGAFAAHAFLYGVAVFGHLFFCLGRRLPSIVNFPFCFVVVKAAPLVALPKSLRGKKQTLWTLRTG